LALRKQGVTQSINVYEQAPAFHEDVGESFFFF
jgi:hypothetical protein